MATRRRTPRPPSVGGAPPARRRAVRPRRPPGRGRSHPGRLPPDRQPLACALERRGYRRPTQPWRTGPHPRLSDAQLQQAEQALLEGAKAHGFDTDLWTLDRVAEVIWRLTGVRHHPDRALDLGTPRQDPGAGAPLQLAACLDRRRLVLWLGWWWLSAGIPRPAWQLQHRAADRRAG
jgi:hypothetical protein